jgi:hypothetical protein
MAEDKDQSPELEVKELDDGTAEIGGLSDEVKAEAPEVVEAEAQKEETPPQDEDHQEENEEDDDKETPEDRERIREARREERKLKKELQKQREVTAKNKIASLERQNQELAKRLASLESTASSFQISQADKAVEDATTRVEYYKLKMLEAAKAGNPEEQIQFMEQFSDAKQALAQAESYKKNQLEEVKRPKQNVPNPISNDVQRLATGWMKKNGWYDPSGRDTDSRIAKVIDNEMATEGWDPADEDYWSELDNRLQERLPHRYNRPGETVRKAAGPTRGVRAQQNVQKPNTITLSRERVQAIKDAGAWDDPARRMKMIKAYQSYDKSNKG